MLVHKHQVRTFCVRAAPLLLRNDVMLVPVHEALLHQTYVQVRTFLARTHTAPLPLLEKDVDVVMMPDVRKLNLHVHGETAGGEVPAVVVADSAQVEGEVHQQTEGYGE